MDRTCLFSWKCDVRVFSFTYISKSVTFRGCVTCHLFDGGVFLIPLHGSLEDKIQEEITAWWVWIEINCLQQIKDVSLNLGQPLVNLWASFSSRLIYISKWHIYIQQNMRLHFVLHLCWHLIQKTTAKRARLFSDPF